VYTSPLGYNHIYEHMCLFIFSKLKTSTSRSRSCINTYTSRAPCIERCEYKYNILCEHIHKQGALLVYVFIYNHMFIYTCLYTYVVDTLEFLFICFYICAWEYTYKCVNFCKRKYVYMYIYTYIHIYMYVNKYTYMYGHTCTYT